MCNINTWKLEVARTTLRKRCMEIGGGAHYFAKKRGRNERWCELMGEINVWKEEGAHANWVLCVNEKECGAHSLVR